MERKKINDPKREMYRYLKAKQQQQQEIGSK